MIVTKEIQEPDKQGIQRRGHVLLTTFNPGEYMGMIDRKCETHLKTR